MCSTSNTYLCAKDIEIIIERNVAASGSVAKNGEGQCLFSTLRAQGIRQNHSHPKYSQIE